MFQRLNKLTHLHRARLTSLVLLPAFFLSTLPHTACICADGHREATCKALVSRLVPTGFNASACSCCNTPSSCEARSCCRGKHSQTASSSHHAGCGLVAKSKSCCQPIIETPAPASATAKGEPAKQALLGAMIASEPALFFANENSPSLPAIGLSTPPPLDAVIVFQHLTI
jgi:hypothetical protein